MGVIRRASRLGSQAVPQEVEQVADARSEPDAAEEAVIRKLDVSTALRTLSREERLLLQLRYEEDLAQPHIARLLGIPEGTIKVRLHRIRHRLKADLRDQG